LLIFKLFYRYTKVFDGKSGARYNSKNPPRSFLNSSSRYAQAFGKPHKTGQNTTFFFLPPIHKKAPDRALGFMTILPMVRNEKRVGGDL